jgi:hypothetical protein
MQDPQIGSSSSSPPCSRCLFWAVQDPFEPDRERTVVRLAEGALAISSIAGHRWQIVGVSCIVPLRLRQVMWRRAACS